MKITFVTRRYWPAIGGVEQVAVSLGETLSEMGHEVKVVAQCVDEGHFGRMTHIVKENERFAAFRHKGVRVEQFRPSRRRRALLLPFMLELVPLGGRLSQRWLRAHTAGYYAAVVRRQLSSLLASAEVVHVLGGEVMAVAAVETAQRLGKPVAISPFAHPGDWGFDAGSIRAYRHADTVIATTSADAANYRAIGVPPQRMQIVGLPVAEIPPDPPAGPTATPDASPLVVFLGARRPTKGVDLLLAAAPIVWQRHPTTRFAFVGPGDPLQDSDPRILDVGRVSDAGRAEWLSRATVLCLPSSSESFGLVVPEAWSHRVPVVVSDHPVLAELVRVSGGGVSTPRAAPAIADAIATLIADAALAQAMGRRGWEYWREHLTSRAVAARHLAIYEGLLSDGSTAPSPERSSSYASTIRSAADSAE
jgi:glycosyltransferase involved in cell wall biosynthesis